MIVPADPDALRSAALATPAPGLFDQLLDHPAGTSWIVLGLASQAVIALALLVYWNAGQQGGRRRASPLFGYAAVIAGFALLAYAVAIREPVFAIGQVVNTLVFARIAGLIRSEGRRRQAQKAPKFPIVAPDSAELKIDSIRNQSR